MQCDGDCKKYVPEELFISSDYELFLLSNYVVLSYNFFYFLFKSFFTMPLDLLLLSETKENTDMLLSQAFRVFNYRVSFFSGAPLNYLSTNIFTISDT